MVVSCFYYYSLPYSVCVCIVVYVYLPYCCCNDDPPHFLTISLCRIAFLPLSPPGYYAHLTFVPIALPFH